ncbi:M23 family metallopeptidase [Pararhodonellum marinum]|uniref:M23 family metallopeptidase n=1 Tax=Pararhodonellum marinum TaxID=2755358 RepID=UPI001E5CB61C|nr:M23 family metallopeptidase [Pararhodonellum marinum]
MKLNKAALILLIGVVVVGFAPIEKGYYQFPIRSGMVNYLSGNMAEIRPNHFHSGIDIKTEGRQGLPVYAAADGYVSRMKISSFGYGNIIYLRHPNGQYTVYAHLKDFVPEIGQIMKEKMYELQLNEFEYFPEAGSIPVKKGDVIAYSGNTGSSAGPHLHFEIRDSLDRALDPMKFGFDEIKDDIPPRAVRIALKPLDIDSRVEGLFQRKTYPVYLEGNKYVVRENIRVSGNIGVEVYAYDQLNDAHNRNGFPIFKLSVDKKPIFHLDVDKIDFNTGRFLLMHTHRNTFTKLYKENQNLMDFYHPDSTLSGSIRLLPEEKKEIEILMQDVSGNSSKIEFLLQGEPIEFELRRNNSTSSGATLDYDKNHLIINGIRNGQENLAKVHVGGLVLEIPPVYQGTNKRTYLWDMELGLPDSVDICTETVFPPIVAKIPARESFFFSDGNIEIHFRDQTLLADTFIRVESTEHRGYPGVTINDEFEYLWQNMEVEMNLPGFQEEKNQLHVYQLHAPNRKNFVGGEWNSDKISFKTRNFGTFVLARDNNPPTIRPVRINSREMMFNIQDDLSGIDLFELKVNGEWIQLRYEYKSNLIWTDKLRNEPFKGDIELKVRDKAGNERIFNSKI